MLRFRSQKILASTSDRPKFWPWLGLKAKFLSSALRVWLRPGTFDVHTYRSHVLQLMQDSEWITWLGTPAYVYSYNSKRHCVAIGWMFDWQSVVWSTFSACEQETLSTTANRRSNHSARQKEVSRGNWLDVHDDTSSFIGRTTANRISPRLHISCIINVVTQQ